MPVIRCKSPPEPETESQPQTPQTVPCRSPLATVQEAAVYLRVSMRTIRELKQLGILKLIPHPGKKPDAKPCDFCTQIRTAISRKCGSKLDEEFENYPDPMACHALDACCARSIVGFPLSSSLSRTCLSSMGTCFPSPETVHWTGQSALITRPLCKSKIPLSSSALTTSPLKIASRAMSKGKKTTISRTMLRNSELNSIRCHKVLTVYSCSSVVTVRILWNSESCILFVNSYFKFI
jgi:hypothetical protein